MTSEPTTTLTAHCFCKAHVFTTTVPLSKLPLPADICHCGSCRHVTGALYSIDTRWPEPPTNVDLSKLKKYNFSDRIAVFFCGTCSTPMFFGNNKDPSRPLGVFVGTIQNDAENLVYIKQHIFVGDTIDGGATMWLRKPNVDGTEPTRFKERSEGDSKTEMPPDWPSASELTGYEKKTEDSIPIRCKCQGVDFVLHRGNHAGKKREDLPFYVDPVTHKNVAGFCACDSCRLFSGVDIFHWTFTHLAEISFSEAISREHGKTFPTSNPELKALVDAKDPSIGTLAYYSSSPGVERYFCSNCSGCIFFACDERPTIVDVAIGALEASDGARAEGFLSWAYGRVIYINDCKGGWRENLMKRVEQESEDWRIERGYPKNARRVQVDAAELQGIQSAIDSD